MFVVFINTVFPEIFVLIINSDSINVSQFHWIPSGAVSRRYRFLLQDKQLIQFINRRVYGQQ